MSDQEMLDRLLSERERRPLTSDETDEAIRLLYESGLSMSEVADHLAIARSRVRRAVA